MEENSDNKCEVSRRKRRDKRYNVGGEESSEGGEGDTIECSGKYCRSCTAALIADCVALCCCPCALVNILTLAFVKVPWMVGRKCLGKKKKNKIKKIMREGKKSSGDDEFEEEGRIGNLINRRAESGILEIGLSGEGEEEEEEGEVGRVSAKSEAERVWLELYQVGHLGFGRVSFTDIQ